MGGAADVQARNIGAFRKGLSETGYVEGQNVTVAYNWLEGHYERLPALLTDLIRRPVAVIATPGTSEAAIAAKAATESVPIVFGIGADPVQLGLVASLARPGGNATGINFFVNEVIAKRVGLLHELVPKATRIALLINPGNTSSAQATLKEVSQAARVLGLQLQIFKAGSSSEIDAAFAALARDPADALFLAGDAFYTSRSMQLATLAARDRIPMSGSARQLVEAGALMSYGTDIADSFRQVGAYTGNILKGAKPSDLPVVQSSKFELVINQQTARTLGLTVPDKLLVAADQVIE